MTAVTQPRLDRSYVAAGRVGRAGRVPRQPLTQGPDQMEEVWFWWVVAGSFPFRSNSQRNKVRKLEVWLIHGRCINWHPFMARSGPLVLELFSPSSLIMNTAAVQLVNYEFGATHFCGWILGLKQAFVGAKFQKTSNERQTQGTQEYQE